MLAYFRVLHYSPSATFDYVRLLLDPALSVASFLCWASLHSGYFPTYILFFYLQVSHFMGSRSKKQVMNRYNRSLHPSMQHGRWTAQEDVMLLIAVKLYGDCSWTKVSYTERVMLHPLLCVTRGLLQLGMHCLPVAQQCCAQ